MLVQLAKKSFPVSFSILSVYSKTMRSSQSQTKYTTALLNLDSEIDFGTPTVQDLLPEITTSSQESFLPAWKMLLSHKQIFLKNHLARVPITPVSKVL